MNFGILLIRLATASLMFFNGIFKVIHGHDYVRSLLDSHGLPKLLWIGVPIAEVLAPVLLILGVLNRLSGLLIAGVMIFSMYLFYGEQTFVFNEYGGITAELNLLFLFNGLAIFFIGGGKYTILKSKKWLLS